MTTMKTCATVRLMMAVAMCAMVAPLVSDAPVRAAGSEVGSVSVTVKYTGKGTVDQSHQIWIWLFDTPDIGPTAMPIGAMSLAKNGGAVTFAGVTAAKVWIAMMYDENGNFAGMGPPPTGSPVAIHVSAAGAPEAVTPGEKTTVTITFDDSQRMP